MFLVDILDCDSLRAVLRKDKKRVSGRHTRTDRCNIFHGFTRDICGNDRRDSTWREDCLWYDNGSRLKNLGKQNCILVLELCIAHSGQKKKTFACIVFVFKSCTEKTGLALVSTLHNTIVSFNKKIQALCILPALLFPTTHDYQPEIDLENMEFLAMGRTL